MARRVACFHGVVQIAGEILRLVHASGPVIVRFGPMLPGATSLNDPTVLVEVLSNGSVGRDRVEKWRIYQKLPSLQHYVLIERDKAVIEVFDRAGDAWFNERIDRGPRRQSRPFGHRCQRILAVGDLPGRAFRLSHAFSTPRLRDRLSDQAFPLTLDPRLLARDGSAWLERTRRSPSPPDELSRTSCTASQRGRALGGRQRHRAPQGRPFMALADGVDDAATGDRSREYALVRRAIG